MESFFKGVAVLLELLATSIWGLTKFITTLVAKAAIRFWENLKDWYSSMKSMWFRGQLSKANRKKRIFIYGAPQVGKSTFMASLVRRLRDDNDILFRRDPVNNREGVTVMKEWLDALDSGAFPENTDDGVWESIYIDYSRKVSGKKFQFIFQEIAGETAVRFDPTHEDHERIGQTAKDFLFDSNGVILIASAQSGATEEKDRISDFLELLYRSSYGRPILLLLTKYDMISAGENLTKVAKKSYRSAVELLADDQQSELLKFGVTLTNEGKLAEPSSNEDLDKILGWMETL